MFVTFIVSNGMSTVASYFCPKPIGPVAGGGTREFDAGGTLPFCIIFK